MQENRTARIHAAAEAEGVMSARDAFACSYVFVLCELGRLVQTDLNYQAVAQHPRSKVLARHCCITLPFFAEVRWQQKAGLTSDTLSHSSGNASDRLYPRATSSLRSVGGMHMHEYITRSSAQRSFTHGRAAHGRDNIPVTPEGICTTPSL